MPALGSPGFVGSRLREAREARGISAISLAELVGLSRSVISQYEHGHTAPTPDKLYIIASKLSLPVDYFLQPPRPLNERVVFYRSLAGATKAARSKAEARLEWLGDIVRYLTRFAELAPVSIPNFEDEIAALPVQRPLPGAFIEYATTAVRQAWGLDDGPIPDAIRLIENHGGVTTRGVMETLSIDAFSFRLEPEGRPCLFLGADKDSAARSRFDAAHELGHAVLHRGLATQSMTPAERQNIEADAHRFAGAFLLPAIGFARDLRAPTLEAMIVAKSRWVVSVGAMIQRCTDLEILRPAEARRLWIARVKRGWSKHEPLDDDLPIEEPSVLRRGYELLVREGGQTPLQILGALALSPTDIESLAGLPSGFFADGLPPVRLIDRMLPTNGDGRKPHGGAVVEFPGG